MRVHAAPACVVIALLSSASIAAGQSKTRNGLFIASGGSQLELTSFAEPAHGRRLRMAKGALDAAPLITPTKDLRILCRLPSWQPSALVVGTQDVFELDDTETRTLPFAVRRLNVFAVEVRAAALEQPADVARLLDTVRASGDNQGYLFVVLFSGGLMRYYPVRLALAK